MSQRVIDIIDIVNDQVPDHKYKESEDPKKVKILKTNPNRGPLKETWKQDAPIENIPIMCAYKIVKDNDEKVIIKKKCTGRESNPGRPRGRRAFYH